MASLKFGFVTVDPVSGSGDQAVSISGDKYTGRLERTINLIVVTNGGVQKALVVNQAAAAESVTSDSPTATVAKTGGNVTITGKSNSTKLTFAATPAEENGLTLQLPENYTAAGKQTANGAIIADDPGATGEFVWSITISNVPANVSIEELVATLSVTAAGGQKAQVTITQAAGDSTLEIDKETINLDVNGSAQTVNVTSNDEWTWKNAASRTVMRMLGRL
ncbi:MAG: Putative binding domain, N-terminal [Bacteriophage sp.]|nr:MAG: Putative binding domain, N-terminal [Bacteriophage sp.]